MFWMDKSKVQGDEVLLPEGLPPDVIISPDTQRGRRLPPGQSRTKKWPVLDASGPPSIDLERWRLRIGGLTGREVEWNWQELLKLPRVKVSADFHCVTRWSRLGNIWEGVSTRELLEQAGGALPQAAYVVAHGYDRGWTTNLPLADFRSADALVALYHDGQPITAEHGGPARLIVPQLYAWKSAKWLAAIELLERDRAGFWEKNGYHARRPMVGRTLRLELGIIARPRGIHDNIGVLFSKHPQTDEFEKAALPHLKELYRAACRLLGDSTKAEDVVQEAYLQAWKSFDRFAPGTNCRAWLFKILINTIHHYRRKWLNPRMVMDSEETLEQAEAAAPPIPERITEEEILRALDRVPPDYRLTILLADVEEFSYKEIAGMLNVPIGTVMSRLSRGRKMLRLQLSELARSYGIGRSGEEGRSA